MVEDKNISRVPEADVDDMFLDRWSPRSFLPNPLSENQLMSLFEAARWSPSSFNEQPWVFFYAVKPGDRERFLSALVERNQLWASKAPVLMFVAARKTFLRNMKPNRAALFDAGSAWMSLALQARKLGLYTHAMAGFSQDKAHEILGLPKDDYEVVAAITAGHRGDPSRLPEDMAKMESPNSRKPLSEVAFEGGFPSGE